VLFNTVTVSGYTFAFGSVAVGINSVMTGSDGVPYAITSGSATITLSPNGAPGVGTFSGTFNVVSSLATLNGTITGTYLAQ
jgi:hypothetical protein